MNLREPRPEKPTLGLFYRVAEFFQHERGMKPGVFQGKKFPFTPKRRKKSLGSQCNNIIDTRHDLAAFRSKLANVSWLRSYKDTMGGGQGDMATWEKMRDDIFDIAKHLYAQCCLQHPHLYLPNGQRVYGRPKRRTWKIPGVRVSAKNKSMPLQLDTAKTREIFTQVGHMFTTPLKKCGRFQNVLLHKYMNTFTTLEIVDQKHLIHGFLKPAQELYRSRNITPVAFEFDVERMYPNISRDRVIPPCIPGPGCHAESANWKVPSARTSTHAFLLPKGRDASWTA